MLTALASFAIPCLVLVLLPGPDTLVILRGLVRGGRRGGIVTAIGVLGGVLVWVFAAVVGLSALLRASEVGYTALKFAGAFYLVWIGVQSLRSIRRGHATAPDVATVAGVVAPRHRSAFMSGFLSDVLNPKVGVAFVTFMPGFIPAGEPVALTSFVLGLLFIAMSAVYFAVLIGLSGNVSRWMNTPHIRRRLDALTGTVLVGFGIHLAAGK